MARTHNRLLVKTYVVMGGVVMTLLALLVMVELLQALPVRDMTATATQYWHDHAGAKGLGEVISNYIGFYLQALSSEWTLLLVPVLGVVITQLALQVVGDDIRYAQAERIHELDGQINQLKTNETHANTLWERTEHGFDSLVQNEPSAWLVVDRDQKVRRWNRAAHDFLKGMGVIPEEIEGRAMVEIWPGWLNTALYRKLADKGNVPVMNEEIELPGVPVMRLQVWMWPFGDHTAMLLQDISHLDLSEEVITRAQALARQLVEDSVRPVAVLDLEGRYLSVSRKWSETFGLDPQVTQKGIHHAQAVPGFPADFGYALQQLAKGQLVGKEDERRVVSGQEETLSWHIRPWYDVNGRPAGYIFTVVNNTELLKLRAQVKDAGEREHALAYSDMLTGLPNRQLFNDRLNMALAQAYRQLGKVALLFLDLDGFKAVNDKLGHDAGDMLLKQVADRLKTCIRQTDTVARLGGDEFTMILHIRDKNDAEQVAQKILKVIREPYNLGGKEAFVGTSIGIALYPQDGVQAADLIRMADNAMYAAKQAGKNTWRFHSSEVKSG